MGISQFDIDILYFEKMIVNNPEGQAQQEYYLVESIHGKRYYTEGGKSKAYYLIKW